MGKATRWLKGLLGIKRSDPNSKRNPAPTPLQPHTTTRIESRPKPSPNSPKEKRRWSFVKSYREKSTPSFTSRPHADSVLVAPQLRSQSGESPSDYSSAGGDDPSKHAIAVAAASAAAADAAVAAAKAAAAVVRLTSSGRSNNVRVNNVGREEEAWAALVIQSHFRGYLARRALRALKGLVKLQALVRGHIMRKKASETMRCMQAMLRAQARARADRGLPLLPSVGGVSPHSSGSKSTTHPGPPTPEKFERAFQAKIANRDQSPLFKRNSSRSSGSRGGQDQVYYSSSLSDLRTEDEHPTWDQHRGDKILEIDPGKPGLAPPKRRKNLFETSSHSGVASDRVSSHLHSCTTSWDSTAHQQATISPTSVEVVQQLPPLNPLKFAPFTANNYNHLNNEEDEFCTAENSPQFYSVNSSRSGASSRRGFGIGAGVGAGAAVPYTPTKSDGSFSGLSGYSDCPSYMACTESSRAKMRSLSAPRQRPNYEQLRTSSSSTKRWSAHHHGSYGDAGRSSTQIIRGSDHHLEVPTSSLLHYAGYVAASGGKAYPGSGRLDRLGMPVVKDNTVVYYSGYLN